MTSPPRTPSDELQFTSISSPFRGTAHETGPWVTRDDAEFFNSLCPTRAHDFPALPGVPVDERSVAKEACLWGFRTLDDLFIDRLQRAQGFQQRERALLLAIYRKTFSVGKVLEKIPVRFFVDGQPGDNLFGHPYLRPTGLDDSGVHKAERLLCAKGWIGKVPSDAGRYASSFVFCPLPLFEALQTFWNAIQDRLHERLDDTAVARVEAALWPRYEEASSTLLADNRASKLVADVE